MSGFLAPADDLVSGQRTTAFGDTVLGGATPSPARARSMAGEFWYGLSQLSSSGLALRGQLPEQADPDAPWHRRLARNVGAVVGDLPAGIIGAAAGTPGGPVGQFAGGFAAPMALRDALMEAYGHNEALSWKGAADIMWAGLKGGGKGAVIGAATGGAGRVVAPMLAPAGKIATGVGTTAAELTALTATSAALEQHMPTWQDFMDNAILLGGTKGAVAAARSMRNIFAETGKLPTEQVSDAMQNPALKAEILGQLELPANASKESLGLAQEALNARLPALVGEQTTVTLKDGAAAVIEVARAADGELAVRASVAGKEVGFASGTVDVRKGHSFADVEVSAPFRRQGVATAMYDFIENLAGVKLSKSGVASADAAAFWTHRDANAKVKTVPAAYEPLAIEQRIEAALGQDPRTESIRAMFNSDTPPRVGEPPIKDPTSYEYITDRETARGVLRVVAQEFDAEAAKQTRGVVTNKQSAIEAAEMISGDKLAPHVIGESATAGEIYARAHLLRGAANHAVEVLKDLSTNADPGPIAKLAAQAAIERVAMLKAEMDGVGAEAGRALQIFRTMKRDPSFLGEAEILLKAAERKGSLQDIAKMVEQMKDPAQMAAFAKKYTEATTFAKVVEAWRAGLFSGPLSWQANIMGNTARWFMDAVEKPTAAVIGAATRLAQGDPLKMSQIKARALAPLYGLELAVVDGIHLAGEGAKLVKNEGLTGAKKVVDAIRKEAASNNERVDVINQANVEGRSVVETAAAKGVGFSFGALKLQDLPFRTIGERTETYVMAVDRAVKDGWHPSSREFKEAVASYVQEPTKGLEPAVALKVTERIEAAGADAVFATGFGPRMAKASAAISGTAWEFLLPARRTPANLLDWAVQRIPGLNVMSSTWRADFMAGGDRQANALARVVVGTGLAGLAYSFAEQGLLTGGGLTDRELGRTKEGAGQQNYSLKVGDKWYSIQRMEPVAKVMMLAADLVEIAKSSKTEGDPEKAWTMLVLAFGNATVSTTYLSGLANMMKATLDPERYGNAFVESYATTLVPKIVGQSVMIADPLKREVDGAMDAIQSQLPYFREKLLPKRDVWSEPVQNNRWFDVMPVSTTKQSEDKVRTEALRLQVAMADAPKYLQEKGPLNQREQRTKLTDEQRDIYRQVSGQKAMAILGPIVAAPDWERIPDFAKVAVFKAVVEATHKQGAYAALPPEAAERLALRQKIIDKVLKQVTEAESK